MRALLWLGGVVIVSAALLGAGRLGAEDEDNKHAAPRTRIGLVNLTYVIKNYQKYKDFQEEIKDIVEPFQRKDAQLRKKMDKLRAEAGKLGLEPNLDGKKREGTAKKKEALESKAKQLQREMEDNQAQAKLKLGERSDQEMKILFGDVEEAVKRYAASHDLDAVLHFNDATTREDYYSVQNIARKLNSGGLMPLTSVPGIDISKDIADLLNFGPRKKS
jgi:Skp family chaperone for outer membrane proteins